MKTYKKIVIIMGIMLCMFAAIAVTMILSSKKHKFDNYISNESNTYSDSYLKGDISYSDSIINEIKSTNEYSDFIQTYTVDLSDFKLVQAGESYELTYADSSYYYRIIYYKNIKSVYISVSNIDDETTAYSIGNPI